MVVEKTSKPPALLFHSMGNFAALPPPEAAVQAAELPAPSYGTPLQLGTYLCDLQLN